MVGRPCHVNMRSHLTFTILQSSADLFCSFILLLSSLMKKDAFSTKYDGILGDLECAVWNGDLFLWAGLATSTWKLGLLNS